MPTPKRLVRTMGHSNSERPFDWRPSKNKSDPPRTLKVASNKCGRCPVCNKGNSRREIFEERYSPLNQNPDGSVRTVEQIIDRLNQEASAWLPDFRHTKCKEQ